MGYARRMPPPAGGAVLFHLALCKGKGMAEKAAQRAAGSGISRSGERSNRRDISVLPHTPAGHAFSLILFFGGGRGRGGRATAKPVGNTAAVQTGLPLKWSGRKRGAGLSNPVPHWLRCYARPSKADWFLN